MRLGEFSDRVVEWRRSGEAEPARRGRPPSGAVRRPVSRTSRESAEPTAAAAELEASLGVPRVSVGPAWPPGPRGEDDGLRARANAIEKVLGLGLVTFGVALVASIGAACIVAGAVIFTFAICGRLSRWGA